MKADLDENGVMRITPETPTEAFALKHWVNSAWVMHDDMMRAEQGHWRGSKLLTQPLTPNNQVQRDAAFGGSAAT